MPVSRSKIGWIVEVNAFALPKHANYESLFLIVGDRGHIVIVRELNRPVDSRFAAYMTRERELPPPYYVPPSCVKKMVQDLKLTFSIEELLTHENLFYREAGLALSKLQ